MVRGRRRAVLLPTTSSAAIPFAASVLSARVLSARVVSVIALAAIVLSAIALAAIVLSACGEPCVEGSPCTPPGTGNACFEGVLRCTLVTDHGEEALPHCEPSAPRAPGSACGDEGFVCDGSGTCVGCTDGESCHTENPCAVGVWSCFDAAGPTCAILEHRAAGTPCGTSGACNAGGFCEECVDPPHACDTGVACTRGEVRCEGPMGAPECVPVPSPVGERCGATGRGRCDGSGACVECAGSPAETACGDDFDDDCDGLIDCADPDCMGGICDDGVFCNGADTCSGGSCGDHAGDPCGGAGTCDEAAGTCTCASDADCPAETRGPLGSCMGGADPCAAAGTQAQTVTSYRCVSGTCSPTTTTDTSACTRNTEGLTCGATTYGSWGSCTFPTTCAETGTQLRSVTTRTCGAGSCRSNGSMEIQSCDSRETDGVVCGSTTYGSWTCAFPDACASVGEETRPRTSRRCMAGACTASTVDEARGCSRPSMEGQLCTGCSSTYCACFGDACADATFVRASLLHAGADAELNIECGASMCSATNAASPTCEIYCPWVSGGAFVDVFCASTVFPVQRLEVTAGGISTTCPPAGLPLDTALCSARAGNTSTNQFLFIECDD
ncbi:MAG: hypothetical protein AB7S26_35495 [Sandaracinaceae bacterium]